MRSIPLGFILILFNIFSNLCNRIKHTFAIFINDFQTWRENLYAGGQGCDLEVSQFTEQWTDRSLTELPM